MRVLISAWLTLLVVSLWAGVGGVFLPERFLPARWSRRIETAAFVLLFACGVLLALGLTVVLLVAVWDEAL